MTVLAVSLPNDRYRRVEGFLLGALVGALFATVWQAGDRLAMPGVPLHQPPFGLAGNIAMFALGGGLLGLVTAWPRGGMAGTFIAAAISAITIVTWAYVEAAAMTRQDLFAAFLTGTFVVLPFWGLLVPALGALRWVVGRDEEAMRDREKWWRRVWPPLVLLLAVGLLSLTARYRETARTLIIRTNDMLASAQAAGVVPAPLAETEFATRGQGAYKLAWEGMDIEKYRIPRPGRNFNQHSVVVARFSNGWNLVCLYITLEDPPLCQGMEELPR